MGTYMVADFMAVFGGMPERGEAAVDVRELADRRRDADRDERNVRGCCDGCGQVFHGLGHPITPCRDRECGERRDAEFMGEE